jgi:hypothetical protein
MKLRLILASCVLALSACASTGVNGPNATDANLLDGAQAAYVMGKSLYDAGKINDDDAEAIVTALRAIHTYVGASQAAKKAGDKAGEAYYLRLAAATLDQITAILIAKKG